MRNQRIKLALTLLFAAGAVYWACYRFTSRPGRPPVPSQLLSSGPSAQTDLAEVSPAVMRKFLELEAQQNELDATVWAKELLAERHEQVFIRLWDELRTSPAPFRVLADFPFGQLGLPTASATNQHDAGVKLTRFNTGGQKLTPDGWRQLLANLGQQGWRLEQSEWRQPQFDLGGDGSARSVIAFKANALIPGSRTAASLKGTLRVTWDKLADANSAPFPRWLEVTELELAERHGPPAFQAAISTAIEPETNSVFIDPLILQDLNGDGLSEVILGSKNRVFWNRGEGRFEPRKLCPRHTGLLNAGVVADFNGDGHADFLAIDKDGLLLFAGDAQGRFDQPGQRGWSAPEPLLNPFVVTAGDVDGDGDLDVWFGQYKLPYVAGQMPTPYYDANDGFPAFLLVNEGRGRFTDQTEQAGLAPKRFRRTYSASFVDVDEDGDPDLIVVSDFAGVDLYRNDGRGRFTDVTRDSFEETHLFGMSHTFGDYDLDGRLDVMVIGMDSVVAQRLDSLKLGREQFPAYQQMRPAMAYGNRMYLARGAAFRQATFNDQVARTGWSWGSTSFDFDNDGDLDLYLANGHKSRASAKDYETQFWTHDIYLATSEHDPARDVFFRAVGTKRYGAGESYGGYAKNALFLNEGGRRFLDVAYFMGVALEEDCRNAVADDLDGDGKLDLLVTTYLVWPENQQALHLFRNDFNEAGHWIGFRLRESQSGFSPVGAKLTLTTTAGQQHRWLVTGDSYRAQHATTAHFGLGTLTNVESVAIRWPNGKTQRLVAPAINRYHEVRPEAAR
ncbi:MAG: CRTAC1 family protein [Verrucomicrobia bacterium]|nr:CRTAC1 family protein [Verrucomicrobiota bacterium]